MSGLRSMTGFAEASVEEGGRVVRASVRSVNHRFLDLQTRLPEGFEALEPIVQRRVREKLRRGHIDVFVRIESTLPPVVRVNRGAAELYLRTARELAERFDLKSEPDLGSILRLPGVVEAAGVGGMQEGERVGLTLDRVLAEALDQLDGMRATEGKRLGNEMAQGLERLAEDVGKVQGLSEAARGTYSGRLKERIRELLGTESIDPARLAQEIALLASRSDTTEESARLHSHVEQFGHVLEGVGEAGKKLDFLCQEMLREVNTTLAKTPALGPDGLEITRLVLAVKAEIEKLREQAQNIE